MTHFQFLLFDFQGKVLVIAEMAAGQSISKSGRAGPSDRAFLRGERAGQVASQRASARAHQRQSLLRFR